MREKNAGKIFVGAGLFLAISYTFLIGHIDGNTIMHWAYGILSERNMALSLYYSIVPEGMEYSDLNLIIDMIGGYCSYVRFFAATLMVAGIVLVLVIDVMKSKKEGEAETDCIIGQSVCYALPGVVLLAYEVLVICYQLLG